VPVLLGLGGEEEGARAVARVLADDPGVPGDEVVEGRGEAADQLEVRRGGQRAGERPGGVDVGEHDRRGPPARFGEVGHAREHRLVALADQRQHARRQQRGEDQGGARDGPVAGPHRHAEHPDRAAALGQVELDG
jgi:hypothetical protein